MSKTREVADAIEKSAEGAFQKWAQERGLSDKQNTPAVKSLFKSGYITRCAEEFREELNRV